MGSAKPANPNLALNNISVGKVELQRRRISREGKTKVKLSLLGVTVERCQICLSQFKEDQPAALLPNCTHRFVTLTLIELIILLTKQSPQLS